MINFKQKNMNIHSSQTNQGYNEVNLTFRFVHEVFSEIIPSVSV